MASILIISKGDGIPIALKLAKEGHVVKVVFPDEGNRRLLKGMRNPSQMSNVANSLEQFDLILFDMVGYGDLATQMEGKPVLGGGSFNDKIELDRDYGERVARTLLKEVSILESKSFELPSYALEYLDTVDKPYVLKPFYNKDVHLLFIDKDKNNLLLKSMIRSHGREIFPCLLQEKVEGIEVSTEGWFNGSEFCHFNHTFEVKRLFDGDKGPLTGCAGCLVWATEGDRLTEISLQPLTPLLQKVHYLGPLDVNLIVQEDRVYFIEFTARFGYDAIQALMELTKAPLFDYLWKLSIQQPLPPFKDEYALAVRLSFPPYPFQDRDYFKSFEGLQVLEQVQEADNHLHYFDVKSTNGVPTLAGIDGSIGCVTARGENIRECRRRVYRTLKSIVRLDEVQYRQDIGNNWDKQLEQLRSWKWV